MKIIERKISELIPAEYNPRQLTDKQYQDIKKSLQRFGMVDPIIVNTHKDRKNIIIGGHQRVKVWADLGNETIPTVEVSLDFKKEQELNVRLNKNTGSFDFDALANFFEVDELMDWGFESFEFGIADQNGAVGDDEKDPFQDEGIGAKNQYGVIVLCDDDKQQEDTFKKLTADGYKCKVVVV